MRPRLPHQIKAFQALAPLPHAGILLQKRLGKCAVAIDWFRHKGCQNILVVAPLSACNGWVDELVADGQRHVFLADPKLAKDFGKDQPLWVDIYGVDGPICFWVVNPEKLFAPAGYSECPKCDGSGTVRVEGYGDDFDDICEKCGGKGRLKNSKPSPTEIALAPWDGVCLDESTIIRNPKAQITKIANACLMDVPHRAILTGDVAPNGPEDIFEQMKWLCGGHFMGARNYWVWENENFTKLGYDRWVKPGRLDLITAAMNGHCFRMTRQEAGLGETKTYTRRYCDLPQRIRAVYDRVERDWLIDGVAETKYGVASYSWLEQLCGGRLKGQPSLWSDHKINLLMELLTGEYAHEKVVILFRFNEELRAACDHLLGKCGIPTAAITGETNLDLRRSIRENFQKPKGVRVLLMQTKVARFGLDLSAADTMIRYSPSTDPEDMSQSADRIIHPMKKVPLEYIDLVCRDTRDEDIWEAYGNKQVTSRMFMQQLEQRTAARLARRALTKRLT